MLVRRTSTIPGLLDDRFRDVEITTWDAPLFNMTEAATVSDYLYSHYYPLFTCDEAAERAERVETPLKLTKRGAWAVGRKRG